MKTDSPTLDLPSDKFCVYCGDGDSLEREHVIPVSFWGFRSENSDRQWIIPACTTCNKLASSKVFFSIPSKAKYISQRYKIKYKKVLRTAFWSEDELKEVEYKLRLMIESSLLARGVILRKIKRLEEVADYKDDYFRPKWIEELAKEYKEKMKKLRRKKK